ncbi:unnamed protein product [Cercopithifilaria johnstoni]|uniref:Uncharacterized protein n=1 Tax=Cercopithifilaria johnstoni TaxID=2874296 RepID=A0A8J2LXX5_9BILA|nr:unnamed protein product [Cercopithifilaria johnstoni]
MVLPIRKCVLCPCPTTSTTCPIMPIDHCPCSVQINQLLPCPISSGALQIRNRRRKRQMAEVVVSLDDKLAIEYLRKLGYVEEFNLSAANICYPTNLPVNILSPNEKTAAVVSIPMQSFPVAPSAHQQIPIPFSTNYVPQQSIFGGISGMQPMNFALMPQPQRMVTSGSIEQPKLFAAPPDTQFKMNEDCQPPGRTKSAAAARSRIMLIALVVIVWIKTSSQ